MLLNLNDSMWKEGSSPNHQFCNLMARGHFWFWFFVLCVTKRLRDVSYTATKSDISAAKPNEPLLNIQAAQFFAHGNNNVSLEIRTYRQTKQVGPCKARNHAGENKVRRDDNLSNLWLFWAVLDDFGQMRTIHLIIGESGNFFR